jgi:hypothetical protein
MPNLPEARCDSFSASRTRDVPYYPFRNGFSNDFLQIPMNFAETFGMMLPPVRCLAGRQFFGSWLLTGQPLRFWLMR